MDENNFTPNFIGIGAYKSGSTWLAETLKEHPEVAMPYVKEVRFFSKKGMLYRDNDSWNYTKGLSWYSKQFPPIKKGKITGEFTVYYLYDKETPALIHTHFPNTKILVCLRNPVDRAYSQYWWYKNYLNLEKASTFEKAITVQHKYLEMSLYYKYLKRYYEIFPSKNIKTFKLDDIKNKPEQVIYSLYKFLNIDTSFKPTILYKKVNAATTSKSKTASRLMFLPRVMERTQLQTILTLLKRSKTYHTVQALYTKLNTAEFKYPPMNKDTRKQLNKFFQPDVLKTEQLTGLDLTQWKQ